MSNQKKELDSWTYVPRIPYNHQELVEAYIEHLSSTCGPTVLMKCRGTSRHFIIWLHKKGIAPRDINKEIISRFSRHRCRCHGYTQPALRRPLYIGRVSRFVHYLEETGVISMPTRELEIEPLLKKYENRFVTAGYSDIVKRLYVNEAEHFSYWLYEERISWTDVVDAIIDRYEKHRCICPLNRRRGRLASSGAYRRRQATRAFLSFLRDLGHLPREKPILLTKEKIMVADYRNWLVDCIGATQSTLNNYTREINRWINVLGCDPSKYSPILIRNIVLNQDPDRAPGSVKRTSIVLRSFLRFLIFQGQVSPHLLKAVPPAPRHRRDTVLPRYAPSEKINEIIASCRTNTPIQIRDRAIILLLARLGLRSGDVANLCFDAIDWETGTLLVMGKGRRQARLPLPQDVGDAILEYIETARPRIAEKRIFLTAQAPIQPFSTTGEIGGVVKRVLRRGQIEDVPSGAHMFRHSLATSMLRSGATLDIIGTVLRHTSPSVTSIYAKVDIPMLMSVTQPWPGETTC